MSNSVPPDPKAMPQKTFSRERREPFYHFAEEIRRKEDIQLLPPLSPSCVVSVGKTGFVAFALGKTGANEEDGI